MQRSRKIRSLWATLVLAACSTTPPDPPAESRADTATTPAAQARAAALVQQHTEIWNLMGLSPAAIEELNGIVIALNAQMARHRDEEPAAYAELSAVQRAPGQLTHEDYIANHERRFDALRISPPTRAELLASAEFVWIALHDPDVPQEKRRTAEVIQGLMKSLGGPPPCCDDNLFLRAAP